MSKETYTIQNVEIAKAGDWHGEGGFFHFTNADVLNWANNFKKLERKSPVPLVLGHDEEQELLKNSGLPNAGLIKNVYAKGDTLFGDLTAIPAQVFKIMKNKGYVDLSPEIQPHFVDDETGERYDSILARVALLGGEHKAMLTLKSLDEYAELYNEEEDKEKVLTFSIKDPIVVKEVGKEVEVERKDEVKMRVINGVSYPAEAFAYIPDGERPETWQGLFWLDSSGSITKESLDGINHIIHSGYLDGLPEDDVQAVKNTIRDAFAKAGIEDLPKEVLTEEEVLEMTELEKAKKEVDDLKATNVKLEESAKTANEKLGKIKEESMEETISVFMTESKKKKILPKMEESLRSLLKFSGDKVMTFSKEGKEEEKTVFDLVKEVVDNMPDCVELQKFSQEDGEEDKGVKKSAIEAEEIDGESAELVGVEDDIEIKKFAKEHEISYGDAARQYKEEN